jgi:hypothetical protein
VNTNELTSGERRFIRRALAVRAFLRDPALPGLATMVGLVLLGVGALVYGWYGAARTIYVPLQLPEFVSGGIGGLALIGVGLTLFDLQISRRQDAHERRLNDDLLDETADLVALAPRLEQIAKERRR